MNREEIKKLILLDESIEEVINKSEYTSQSEALIRLLNKENIFLTGLAGTGKTYSLERWFDILKKLDINYVTIKTATTGIAALLIEGITIHSFTAMNASKLNFENKKAQGLISNELLERVKAIDVIIIEEISMLSEWQLNYIIKLFSFARGGKLPNFVVAGDFTQLKPVAKANENKLFKNFCYGTDAWNKIGFKDLYLDRVYRAKDMKLNSLLTKIANGSASYNDISGIKTITLKQSIEEDFDAPVIVTTNKRKEEINKYKQSLNTSSKLYEIRPELPTREEGYSPHFIKKSKELLRELRLNDNVCVKENDLVMIRVNEPSKDSFAKHLTKGAPMLKNGMIGKIEKVELKKGGKFSIIFNYKGFKYEIFRKFEFKDTEIISTPHGKQEITTAMVRAIPLHLAYAITTHKAQGQTYEKVIVDLSYMWQENLGYVTLSRATDFENIRILIDENRTYQNPNDLVSPYTFKISDESLNIRANILNNAKTLDKGRRMVNLYNDIEKLCDKYAK